MKEINDQNNIEEVSIEKEMESSFIDYSMSVIISRAIPDARDGLKPIHRRILYAMHEIGLHHNTAFKKSAKVVGEVIAKYHPHGDQAAYESLVRMAQKFSLRYPLVNGQGNFGSVDGDSAAAMRYTEAKLQKITALMLQDIDKNTVDYIPNYDASEMEPVVLPNKLPNLLINGSTGIAVGMATSIPPHNINEVIDATIYLAKRIIKNEESYVDDLFIFIKGPDFPTGGIILNPSDLKEAYRTGRGKAIIRSKVDIIEKENGQSTLIVKEIPYMVQKAALVQKIVEAAKAKRVNIASVADESNREGMRIVIEIKRNNDPNVELNKLFKHTPLQTTFSINLLALDGNFPRVLNLKEALEIFLNHQENILIRKTNFLLDKAQKRIHILEGLRLALTNIDWTIAQIKESLNRNEAITKLLRGPKEFQAKQNSIGANIVKNEDFLSKEQAEAILEMRLSKLTMLETKNLEIEIDKLVVEINEYNKIKDSKTYRFELIVSDLETIKENFGDERRTIISDIDILDMDEISFVEQKDVAVVLTEGGYLKRIPIDDYSAQNRGGVGKTSIKTKSDDNVKQFVVSNTHSDLLFFTTKGKVYNLKTYKIVEPSSKNTKGIPLINYFRTNTGDNVMDSNEKVEVMLQFGDPREDELIFITKKGIIKKTDLQEFAQINRNGKKAIKIDEDDEIFEVFSVNKNESYEIVLAASNGKAIKFSSEQIRSMSRNTRGVRGINLDKGVFVVGASNSLEGDKVLSLSELGFGKVSNLSDFKAIKRGGKGVSSINVKKAGNLSALKIVSGTEDIIIITNKGTTIRVPLEQINEQSRNTKGVKIVTLRDNETISKVRVIQNI